MVLAGKKRTKPDFPFCTIYTQSHEQCSSDSSQQDQTRAALYIHQASSGDFAEKSPFSEGKSNQTSIEITRKERNRTASKRARERRKQWIDNLYQRRQELDHLLAEQYIELESLKREIFILKGISFVVDQCESKNINKSV